MNVQKTLVFPLQKKKKKPITVRSVGVKFICAVQFT